MRRLALFLVGVGMLITSVNIPCLAQDFKPYAGSKPDEKASREASAAAPGKQSEVYTTGDALTRYTRSTRACTRSTRCVAQAQSCLLDNRLGGPSSSSTEERIC